MDMTEQDILNKIKESADSVEIPEGLKPEQIELKLKDEKKPAKFKWQAMHLVAAAVALVLMLGIIPLGLEWDGAGNDAASTTNNMNEASADATAGQQNATAPEAEEEGIIEEKQDAGELYLVAKSYDEVYDFLKNNVNVYYGIVDEREVAEEGTIVYDMADGAAVNAPTEGMASGGEEVKLESAINEASAHKQGYSTTNLQMAGVDESDIVKTNGSHIFMVKDGAVQIVKIDDGKMSQVGTISPELESFSDSVCEMYVDGNKLVLIVQQVENALEGTSTGSSTGGLLPLTGDTAGICIDYAYNYDVSYVTVLYTYDISNPANAKQIGKMEQDGYYKTSRKIDDMIYLFTQDSIMVEADTLTEDDDKIAELLPTVNGEAISYDCIYLPEYGCQGLVVSSVSLDNPNVVVDNTLIMNDYVEIYVSSSAMYLYNSDYQTDTVHTQIAKFTLKNGRISAVAAASVPGTIQDTFAINEYDGNLRVLTSHWDSNISDRTNQLYILDSALKATGKIENIAEGEIIYAARYFGDLAYFITYRNMDPLFAVDLSDVKNPKILGELEITGYSEYLHMWGEDKLLGIGYETDPDSGRQEGIKLVMFDISNPAELSIIDTVVLKDADYSAALYNYKCVLADSFTNMIGFTTVDYSEEELTYHVYSFADGKFTEELVVENESFRAEESYRGLWAGDNFYMVSPEKIKSFDYTEDYKTVDEFYFK